MSPLNYADTCTAYARQVVDGKITACRWAKSACERHLYDLERWKGADAPYRFDGAKANRVCSIISKFPHVKGKWARERERLKLEPWQVFVLANVFGWTRADGQRRFRTAYLEVPRKNAKSTLSSAVGLYMLACDNEPGAVVISAATTRDQAKLCFNDAQNMARAEDGFRQHFGCVVYSHAITQERSNSHFYAISAEDSSLDGLNLHCGIVDELHAHKTRGLWDVLESATGARTQPLLWGITTAGTNQAGICYEQRQYVTRLLDRAAEDESYFGIIYTTDDADDPFEESTWRKANPNYGVSVYADDVERLATKARELPSALPNFLTKRLNIWCNADQLWLDLTAWAKCAKPGLSLEDLESKPCYIAIDLASRNDITAMVLLFPDYDGAGHHALFTRFYLNEAKLEASANSQYAGWEREGRIIATPGNVTDINYVLDDLDQYGKRFEVLSIGLDPWQSPPLLALAKDRGITVPFVQIKQNKQVMSPAMKELEALVMGQHIHHTGCPAMQWMMSNVIAHDAGNDHIMPQKERPENKIDGPVATIMAIDQLMRSEGATQSIYETRGVVAV